MNNLDAKILCTTLLKRVDKYMGLFLMEDLMKINKVELLYMLITHLQHCKHMANLVSAMPYPILIILKKIPIISFLHK